MSKTEGLNLCELERYSRQLCLSEIGEEGQRRLKHASVLVVGLGGLGSPLAVYLAAAGVGQLGLCEFDAVSLSNLQRQILYTADDLGRPKLWQAKARIEQQNTDIKVTGHEGPLDVSNAAAIIGRYDVVADGTDNFATRYLLNDVCWKLGKPLVMASVQRFEGQLTVFEAANGPCYRCLFPAPPRGVFSCAAGGVLGVLPGILGTLQAAETLKLLLGIGSLLRGRLLLVDALRMRFTELAIPRDPGCALCGTDPRSPISEDYEAFCADSLPTASEEVEDWELTPRAFLEQREEVELIDLRENTQGAGDELPGARQLAWDDLAVTLGELRPERCYVVCCWNGSRSLQAVRVLRAAGFSRSFSLKGGLPALLHEVRTSGGGDA
ncbi:MAG: molybdopterin-synthase adenylyltransferase MoeB [Cyanobacteria bacterium NC_groundwater_1444_Ag_S-0.65um_54_12]|nr:molybdopterin-synthase adenylyltransferase MoeB [Cyanobacteria bacterium NC_groundwater_1444_Ag_S-0.65um_54_12]